MDYVPWKCKMFSNITPSTLWICNKNSMKVPLNNNDYSIYKEYTFISLIFCLP
jgi:hypothetical protein